MLFVYVLKAIGKVREGAFLHELDTEVPCVPDGTRLRSSLAREAFLPRDHRHEGGF